MTPAKERLYWGAVSSLREAESLAQLTASVSGPADEPPRSGDEESWISDWTKRAKGALKKARDLVDSHIKSQVDRGRRIATLVRNGATRISQAGGRAFKSAMKPLGDITSMANTISLAALATSVGLTLLMLAGAWYIWKGK